MLSLGTELFFAFWIASKRVGLPSGSPPPVRAATSMFLMSLANILPRRASMTAFLCLVVAHLECPLIYAPISVHIATPWYRRPSAPIPRPHRANGTFSRARWPGVPFARRGAGHRIHAGG